MIRMSSLPISQYCGAAHRLPNASGRAAAMSSAFHALCHDEEKAIPLLERLTADERADVLKWCKPVEALYSGLRLKYEDAETELEVTLNARGRPAEPGEDASVGHLDMAWCKPWLSGSTDSNTPSSQSQLGGLRAEKPPTSSASTCVFVADIKRSRFTVEDGPESLQLLAYALAYAALKGAQFYACGIWSALDGEWQWGPVRSVRSMETASIMARVLAAAQNDTGEYSSGSHCRRCWARFVCPAHVQRGLEGTAIDTTNLQPETIAETLLKLQAAEDVVTKGLETIKDWVRVNGPIRDGEREYGLVGKQMRWTRLVKAKTRA